MRGCSLVKWLFGHRRSDIGVLAGDSFSHGAPSSPSLPTSFHERSWNRYHISTTTYKRYHGSRLACYL